MLEEFGKLLAEIFPSVRSETSDRFVEALKHHQPLAGELYSPTPPAGLSQADVIGPLDFRVKHDDGEWRSARGLGIILSHSCDIDNDPFAIVAYGYPLKDLASQSQSSFLADVVRNKIEHLLFLPEVPANSDTVFDLSLCSSFETSYLSTELAAGRISRAASLSQFGFYLFTAKLTVHLLRPDPDVRRTPPREAGLLLRLKAAWQVLSSRSS